MAKKRSSKKQPAKGKPKHKLTEAQLEEFLRQAKYSHASEAFLIDYVDGKLDQADKRRVEAHLNFCLLCEKKLAHLKKERQAIDNPPPITEKDRARAKKIIQMIKDEGE